MELHRKKDSYVDMDLRIKRNVSKNSLEQLDIIKRLVGNHIKVHYEDTSTPPTWYDKVLLDAETRSAKINHCQDHYDANYLLFRFVQYYKDLYTILLFVSSIKDNSVGIKQYDDIAGYFSYKYTILSKKIIKSILMEELNLAKDDFPQFLFDESNNPQFDSVKYHQINNSFFDTIVKYRRNNNIYEQLLQLKQEILVMCTSLGELITPTANNLYMNEFNRWYNEQSIEANGNNHKLKESLVKYHNEINSLLTYWVNVRNQADEAKGLDIKIDNWQTNVCKIQRYYSELQNIVGKSTIYNYIKFFELWFSKNHNHRYSHLMVQQYAKELGAFTLICLNINSLKNVTYLPTVTEINYARDYANELANLEFKTLPIDGCVKYLCDLLSCDRKVITGCLSADGLKFTNNIHIIESLITNVILNKTNVKHETTTTSEDNVRITHDTLDNHITETCIDIKVGDKNYSINTKDEDSLYTNLVNLIKDYNTSPKDLAGRYRKVVDEMQNQLLSIGQNGNLKEFHDFSNINIADYIVQNRRYLDNERIIHRSARDIANICLRYLDAVFNTPSLNTESIPKQNAGKSRNVIISHTPHDQAGRGYTVYVNIGKNAIISASSASVDSIKSLVEFMLLIRNNSHNTEFKAELNNALFDIFKILTNTQRRHIDPLKEPLNHDIEISVKAMLSASLTNWDLSKRIISTEVDTVYPFIDLSINQIYL